MQSLPEAPDLLSAVAAWIETSAGPALGGADRFHARVAVNALRVVERELRAGAGHHEPDRDALSRLCNTAPGAGDRELLRAVADEVRSGHHDERASQVRDVLHALAVRKLMVHNPRYLVAGDVPVEVRL